MVPFFLLCVSVSAIAYAADNGSMRDSNASDPYEENDANFSDATIIPKRSNVSNFEISKIKRGYVMCDECLCDVTLEACDVNCCCDAGCTDDDKKVFTDCDNYVRNVDDRFCFQQDWFYVINAPYELVEVEKGFYCLTPSNAKKQQCYFPVEPLESPDDFEFIMMINEASRFDVFPSIGSKTLNSVHVGSPVLIRRVENGEVQIFGVPRSEMGICRGYEAVNYLVDSSSTCETKLNTNRSCENTAYLSAASYYAGFQFLPDVEIRVRSCDFSFESCSDVDAVPEPSYNETSDTCANVIQSLKYVIAHDGTEGIVNVTLDVFLADVGLRRLPVSIFQTFLVVFRSARDDEPDGTLKSGNPGYRYGLPVLAGSLENGSIQLSGIEIPSGDGCEQTEAVEFGTNVVGGCLLSVTSNGTESVCEDVKAAATEAFEDIAKLDHVSAYGNDSYGWVRIIDDNSTGNHFELSSRFRDGNEVCEDVTLSVRLTIMYAMTGKISHPQPKIVGVSRTYLAGEALVAVVGTKSSEPVYSVHLTVVVSFVDATNFI